jgi:hypothetical protein
LSDSSLDPIKLKSLNETDSMLSLNLTSDDAQSLESRCRYELTFFPINGANILLIGSDGPASKPDLKSNRLFEKKPN